PGAGLVEPDVARLPDPQDLEVDPAGRPDLVLVSLARFRDLLPRHVTSREMHVRRIDVDVLEEVLPHVAAEAVDAPGVHRVVLVEVEGHHVAEVEPLLAMAPDQLAVDPDGGAAGRETEHRSTTHRSLLLDDLRDPRRDHQRDLLVLQDTDRDALEAVRHVVSPRG